LIEFLKNGEYVGEIKRPQRLKCFKR
jgi:hypothetical protein